MTKEAKPIQEYLFQHIKERLGPGSTLVDTIAGLLHVSQDSAYRRIRGETLLVLEEVRVLCDHFHISVDQLMRLDDRSVLFRDADPENVIHDFTGYLRAIRKQLMNLDGFDNKQIFYITVDLPIFYQFCFPEVLAFRHFFWMKVIYQHPDFANRVFIPDSLTPDITQLAEEILTLYTNIPSVEIWNTEAVNSLMLQIDYCISTGAMSKAQAATVHDGLKKTIEHVHLQAAYGCKLVPGQRPQSRRENYQLFFNRMGLGDNTILTTHDADKTLYLNYDALNYLVTTDSAFCAKVYDQVQLMMRRSTLISRVSEKQRDIFFNSIYRKLSGFNTTTQITSL